MLYYRYSKYDDVRKQFCIKCRNRMYHLECPQCNYIKLRGSLEQLRDPTWDICSLQNSYSSAAFYLSTCSAYSTCSFSPMSSFQTYNPDYLKDFESEKIQ